MFTLKIKKQQQEASYEKFLLEFFFLNNYLN